MRLIIRTAFPPHPIVRDGAINLIFHEGQDLSVFRDGHLTHFNKVYGRVAARLLLAAGGHVTHVEMTEHVYGDDPSGGPLDPYDTIGVAILRIRQRLAPLGIAVFSKYTRGFYAALIEPQVYRKHPQAHRGVPNRPLYQQEP